MILATIDKQLFPILLVRINQIEANTRDYDRSLKYIESVLEEIQDEKCAIIYDMSNFRYLPLELRIVLGKWMKEKKQFLVGKLVCHVLLNKSVMTKMLIRGVMRKLKPSVPVFIFPSMEEAIRKAESELIKAREGVIA